MTTAFQIVDALLGDEDPKDYILDPRTVYHHGVWDITTKELRQFLRSIGWRVTGAYQRKRGSLSFRAQKPVEPGTNEWGERDKLQQQTEQWLKQKFPDDRDAREIRIDAHVHNIEEWDAEYRPVRRGPTYYAELDVVKANPEGNPYA